MTNQGNFITAFFPDAVQKDLDNQVGVFTLPAIDPAIGTPAEVGGDQAVAFADRPEVWAFLKFLTTPDAGVSWEKAGGALFPYKTQDLANYSSALDRAFAEFDRPGAGGPLRRLRRDAGSGRLRHVLVRGRQARQRQPEHRHDPLEHQASWPKYGPSPSRRRRSSGAVTTSACLAEWRIEGMRLADSAAAPPPRGVGQILATGLGQILVSVFVPVVAFLVLWGGFLFLRDSGAPKVIIVLVAIVWGIGGVAMLYVVANWLTEKLPPRWQRRILPFVFVGPAIAILTFYLLIPAVLTAWQSLLDAHGAESSASTTTSTRSATRRW